MRLGKGRDGWQRAAFLAGLACGLAPSAGGQAKSPAVSDAQVESDVLKGLAASPQLREQNIQSTTVYGVVTLSGSVRDEATRTLAENVISRTAGVQKVVDELTLVSEGSAAAPALNEPYVGAGSNPDLQSDGTLAQSSVPQDSAGGQSANLPSAQPGAAPPYPQQSSQRSYPQQQAGSYPAYPPQQSGPSPNYPAPQGQMGGYPGQPPIQRRGPYGSYPAQPGPGYGAQYTAGGQLGGQTVTVPEGTLINVRLDGGLSSNYAQPGTRFDGVVVSDISADGQIAIPRGAAVQGTVGEAVASGVLKGRGELALQLNQVTLGGQSFSLNSNPWSIHGSDKTVQTVDSAVGMGAVGAIIGAVAGGGAGAAIGAGVGGAAGIGASAASGRGQALVPPEAVISFQLNSPASVVTVSQAELGRLGYGVPNGAAGPVRRAYAPYPYPYGYPYPPVYFGGYYGPRPYFGARIYPRYYRPYRY